MVVSKEHKQRALDVWKHILTGVADSVESKTKMIELYNEVYGENYKTTTNCGSCLNGMFRGIKNIVENGKVRM